VGLRSLGPLKGIPAFLSLSLSLALFISYVQCARALSYACLECCELQMAASSKVEKSRLETIIKNKMRRLCLAFSLQKGIAAARLSVDDERLDNDGKEATAVEAQDGAEAQRQGRAVRRVRVEERRPRARPGQPQPHLNRPACQYLSSVSLGEKRVAMMTNTPSSP
jgi:hypothetical protein